MNKKEKKVLDLLKSKGVSQQQLEVLLESKERFISIRQKRRTRKYKFGIVSDTHLVDKSCALDELHDFYKRCKREGVHDIVHAGDILSGMNVYKGQIVDLERYGIDEHLEFGLKNYPREEGIKTYFILGNHDLDYKNTAGIDIGKHLAKRPDLIYVGMYDATLTLNGITIGLHHGGGGASYALSYKLQKYVEKIGSDQKPQIYILGHYHGAFYMFYRNIHCFLPACFQKPTDLSVRFGLPNCVGGWIVEVEIADDECNSIDKITYEFIPYY